MTCELLHTSSMPCRLCWKIWSFIVSKLLVERTLVQRVHTDLHARSALDEWAVLLHDLLPVFRRHAAHFWAIEGEVPEWEALSLAGSVVASARAALAELPDLRTAADIVQAYVDRWWKVDRADQGYRAGFYEIGFCIGGERARPWPSPACWMRWM